MALFALSYDSVEALARFARKHGITYDLLSDEGSKTIERLGLLNEHVAEQHAYYGIEAGEQHRRLPYPGTLVLDANGIVIERLFDQSYRERPSPGVLLSATGRRAKKSHSTSLSTPIVELSAGFESSTFHPMEHTELTIQLGIAEGWHLYVPPVPEGFRALEVNVGPSERLGQGETQIPGGRPLTVDGIDESFNVVDGSIEITVPVLLQGAGFLADGSKRSDPEPAGPLEVAIEVSFQACSDTECLPPESHTLSILLDEEGLVVPEQS